MIDNTVRIAKSTRTLYQETITHPLYKTYNALTKATLVHIVMTVHYRDCVKRLTMSQSNMSKLVGCERDVMIRIYNRLNKDGWLPQKEKRAGTSNEYVFEIPVLEEVYSPNTGDVLQEYMQVYSPNTEPSNNQEEETNDSSESSQNVPFDPYRDKSLKLSKDELDETNIKLDAEDNISHDFSKQSMTCDDFLKQINSRKSDMVIHLQGKQYYDY